MDSLTQAALGAAIGEAILGRRIGEKGAVIGAVVATIPDLDVILYLFYDKFEMLSIHRGFSHSIVFSILGAGLISLLLQKVRWSQSIKWGRLFMFAWLCLFTHMLLDAFTAYGTQLFLPFSNSRVGLDSINVVDPLYTIPLVIGLIWSLRVDHLNPRRSKGNCFGLVISTLYLAFTLVNKEAVIGKVAEKLMQEKIAYSALLTMPVGIANVHWYGVAKGQDSIYMVEYDCLSNAYGSLDVFPIHEAYLDQIDEEVAEKMRWFAKGFYTVEKEEGKIRIYNLQVDMRGIVTMGEKKAPTVGYFEVSGGKDAIEFSSGSLPK